MARVARFAMRPVPRSHDRRAHSPSARAAANAMGVGASSPIRERHATQGSQHPRNNRPRAVILVARVTDGARRAARSLHSATPARNAVPAQRPDMHESIASMARSTTRMAQSRASMARSIASLARSMTRMARSMPSMAQDGTSMAQKRVSLARSTTRLAHGKASSSACQCDGPQRHWQARPCQCY